MMKNYSSLKMGEKGQALLAILLVMVVGLTVGLSVATRSVIDVKTSTQIEESSRAFAAAEAGIEAALKGDTGPGSFGSDASYIVSTSVAGESDAPLKLGEIAIADTFTVWLVGHNVDGSINWSDTYSGSTIDVCWQKADAAAPQESAMERVVVYKDPSNNYKVSRGAYDPDAVRAGGNNFTSVSGSACDVPYQTYFKKTINLGSLSGTKIAIRLRPFYANANVVIIPLTGSNLPNQGQVITSSGTAGDTTRKVSVLQSFPAPQSIFDYVLFSGTSVSKP